MPLVETPQGPLHYETLEQTAPWQARGLPVLFHHGIGSSSALWRGWYPALIDRHPMVVFDMRGCGRSHIPGPGFKWSLERMVEDLFAVADAAGLARFHLVGESIGGTIGLAAAIARPERIATLTVSNGAHLGATIGRVHAWKKQLDEGGSAGWSKAFMPDRFHADALSPERWQWFETEQARWPRDSLGRSPSRQDHIRFPSPPEYRGRGEEAGGPSPPVLRVRVALIVGALPCSRSNRNSRSISKAARR